jgi:signal transduction histidine kinase
MGRPLAALLLLLVIALGVLATLQYRWIDRVSEAERQQTRANLDFAARRFTDDLRVELGALFDAFGQPDRGELEERYEQWARAAAHPALLENVYVAERRDDDTWALLVLDRDARRFADTQWPAKLAGIHQQLKAAAQHQRIRWLPPVVSEIPAFFFPPRPRFARPEPFGEPDFPGGPPPNAPQAARATIVVLNREQLAKTILPSLADRYFSTAKKDEYDLALTNGIETIYRSSPSWPDGKTSADLDLAFRPVDREMSAARRPPFADPPPPFAPWRLLVHRHDGSLNALVASTRTRNLAVSFAILFILGATALVLAVLLRRADRLRAQQTHFVAAMSHELNTPIAALRSAGENLKDGIVADRDKLARYGETIVKESARLGDMVAQVLDFAGMQARTRPPALQSVDVAAVIEEAIAQCHWILDGSKIHVEVHIDENLPDVRGDSAALTRAVQNLIANAIRHGGSGQWVGVRASRDNGGVTIAVEDRGPGIDGREAARLFEPFYRGQGSSGVRGTGLGLAIVRQIAIAHGGSIDIDKRRRDGAAFLFHLPAAVNEHA